MTYSDRDLGDILKACFAMRNDVHLYDMNFTGIIG